jgi:hypothetical protein
MIPINNKRKPPIITPRIDANVNLKKLFMPIFFLNDYSINKNTILM